ncbi:DUF1682-domain-containing protein [Basidiobolus meristosporus CBS 931.73]|uniref:DUF1682-domain-containing protein n=1 Tax=Basidiobolus meristosporus CBS 931.73 TaxID=1314790 RepID=A0A1Y1Y4Y6_9FUNG|nr:DUF1682-domain-containing protein [Basidiobolus meristosporus CBS 931.73]|eukprot:ORX93092.1 DUF1682-domain-containing protein [Basidiobolus meristosporus CBS 931.73]
MSLSRKLLTLFICLALLSLSFVSADAETQEPATIEEPVVSKALPKPLQLSDFYVEFIFITGIAGYFLQYFRGKTTNEQLAKKWLDTYLPIFRENFAHLGNEKGHFLMKDGPADYMFYATGRAHCRYVMGTMKLLPRHDVIGMMFNLYTQSVDLITMVIQMNEGEYDDFFFSILPKKKAHILRKDRYDINTFGRQVNQTKLPNSFCIFTEHSEVTDLIVCDEVVKVLEECEEFVEEICFSDQPSTQPTSVEEKSPKTISISFRLPPAAELHKVSQLHELAMYLVDYISDRAKFSRECKNKLKKTREEAMKVILKSTAQEREEALQQRKAEERRKKQAEASKLSPEAQRKLEEKQKKKESRKKRSTIRM